jgi:hypothetical protein
VVLVGIEVAMIIKVEREGEADQSVVELGNNVLRIGLAYILVRILY